MSTARAAGVLSGVSTFSPTATVITHAAIGSNASTTSSPPAIGTLSAANYDFTPVNGTLTVNKATTSRPRDNQMY